MMETKPPRPRWAVYLLYSGLSLIPIGLALIFLVGGEASLYGFAAIASAIAITGYCVISKRTQMRYVDRIVVPLVVIAVLSAWAWAYSTRGIRCPSLFSLRKYVVLEDVYLALQSYHESTGYWPDTLDVIRERVPSLSDNDLTGSRKIVYRRPDSRNVVLASFGHRESHPGWNLVEDEVVWLIHADGKREEVSPKTAESLGFGVAESDKTK